ncbi:MAG: vanadium-dependent haloperoxidase, partial [Bacteroidota bacterium]
DPTDGVMWNISPNSLGNIGVETYPRSNEEYPSFYDEFEGGDPSRGHSVNPATGEPYADNIVPRGDYTRILAEFWADGPDSETPPGHWFVIMNEKVLDHPDFVRQFKGEGEVLPTLEFDIKAYLLLGGTMHDVAVSTWGVKGYYDYVRPLTAIRYLAAVGQRTDASFTDNYDPDGINLSPGYIELLREPSEVYDGNIISNLKFRAWRGNRYLEEFGGDFARVGWINAGWWEPYQRPTFVTPNFAGYVSGHSTFSSAAAQVLELLTGDPYFPGGLAEFYAPKDSFLVFEQGPSVDVTLQWATYRDASDQTSLSRIWGGIHPPVDDIPGRFMGIEIGNDAFTLAESLFNGEEVFCATTVEVDAVTPQPIANPIRRGDRLNFTLDCSTQDRFTVYAYDAMGRLMDKVRTLGTEGYFTTNHWPVGVYFLRTEEGGKGSVGMVQLY